MNLTDDKVTEIFYLIDEFCIQFEASTASHRLGNAPKRPPRLSQSEVITMMTLFHYGSFRNMKHFYLNYVQKHLQSAFPKTVSYNRFVELMQSAVLPMTLFLKTCCMGECTGISYVDSTPIRVCKNKRIKRNKVFKDTATVGKSTMGWFFGFKLQLIINDKGEVLNLVITQGNVDDREPLKNERFVDVVKGKLYADKGYLPADLAQLLFIDGIQLITGIRNNMKNCLMELKDKILLRKGLLSKLLMMNLKISARSSIPGTDPLKTLLQILSPDLLHIPSFPKNRLSSLKPQTQNKSSYFKSNPGY